MPMARAEISIDFDEPGQAKTAFGALLPETDDGPDDRGQACIELENDVLNIIIEGNDPAAFRAGIDSYGRWLKMIIGLMDNKE